MDTFKGRLLELIDDQKNLSVFAEKLGLHYQTIQRWLKGGSVSQDNLVSICTTFQVNANWLILGVGAKYSQSMDVSPKNLDHIAIQQMNTMDPNGSIYGEKLFSRSWLEWRLGEKFNPADLRLIKSAHNVIDAVNGGEIIKKDDIVLVDLSQKNKATSSVLLMKLESELYVFRAFQIETVDGSDFENIDTLELRANVAHYKVGDSYYDISSAEILGRAIWIGRDL